LVAAILCAGAARAEIILAPMDDRGQPGIERP
jgi:hypothetical protein